MSVVGSIMNRRTFIKRMSFQLLALMASHHLNRMLGADIARASSPNNAYGNGGYGIGTYGQKPNLDHRIYLPVVGKDTN